MIFRSEMVWPFGGSRILVRIAVVDGCKMDMRRRLAGAGVSGVTGEAVEDEERRQDRDNRPACSAGNTGHRDGRARGSEARCEATEHWDSGRRKPRYPYQQAYHGTMLIRLLLRSVQSRRDCELSRHGEIAALTSGSFQKSLSRV